MASNAAAFKMCVFVYLIHTIRSILITDVIEFTKDSCK